MGRAEWCVEAEIQRIQRSSRDRRVTHWRLSVACFGIFGFFGFFGFPKRNCYVCVAQYKFILDQAFGTAAVCEFIMGQALEPQRAMHTTLL